jgi:hypothetical protein
MATIPAASLSTQNAVVSFKLPDQACVIALTAGAGNAAAADVVLELRIDSNWVTPITLIKPNANPKTEIASLTGPDDSGWVDVAGYREARVRRTDNNGGVCVIEYNVTRN